MSNTTPWYLKEYKNMLVSGTEKRLLGTIERVLIEDSANRNAKRDTEHLHPSEMAKENWCPRQSFYKMTGSDESDPESFSFQRLNIFEEGHQIHDKWQHWMRRCGILVGDWQCGHCDTRWWDKSPERCPKCFETEFIRYREVPLHNDEYHILGNADGLIEDDKGQALVELKSVGLGTIRFDAPNLYKPYEDGEIRLDELWKRIKRPLAAHNRQIQIYMFCYGVKEAIVIYEWKPTQEVREFHLRYEPTIVDPLLKGAQAILDAIEDDIPPARPEAATSKSSKVCQYCPYKSKCWGAKV
jgi:rubrerythrin